MFRVSFLVIADPSCIAWESSRVSPSAVNVSQDVADFEAASEISPHDPHAVGPVSPSGWVLSVLIEDSWS